MKVYHPTTGEVYEGEPVDCRELMQMGGYLKEPPSPDQAQVADAATSGKPVDQTPGKSAKVGGRG